MGSGGGLLLPGPVRTSVWPRAVVRVRLAASVLGAGGGWRVLAGAQLPGGAGVWRSWRGSVIGRYLLL